MSKQYNTGRRFEYQVKKEHEECGCLVIRASGSHGAYDLVIAIPNTGEIILAQCKVTAKSSHALKLAKAWKENPPLSKELFPFQMLAVKVKGEKEYRAYWA